GLTLAAVVAVVCAVCAHQIIREWSRLKHLRRLAHFQPLRWGKQVLLGRVEHSQQVVPVELQPLLEEFAEAWNGGSCGTRAHVVACNEATSEFHALIGFQQQRVRWRVCLMVGVAGAAGLMGLSPLASGMCLLCGAVSASLTWQLGRMADSLAQNLR